jgi:hypothetical protein
LVRTPQSWRGAREAAVGGKTAGGKMSEKLILDLRKVLRVPFD